MVTLAYMLDPDTIEGETTMLALFWGGPQDGREMQLSSSPKVIYFPVIDHEKLRAQTLIHGENSIPSEEVVTGRAVYERSNDVGSLVKYTYKVTEFG